MPGQIQKPIRSLGVLTGGGDVPGLNPAIKALVYRAEYMGIRVVGLRSGWKGITYLDRSRSLDSLFFQQKECQSGRFPRQWIMMCLALTIALASKQQSTGQESLSTAYALLQDLIVRLSFSACSVVMQVSPRLRRQLLPGLIVC